MDLRLLFHNLGFSAGAVIALAFAAFVYLKDRRAEQNITFALAFISIAIFTGSHVIGVNMGDPILSRNALMWNISVIWIGVFLAHCAFSLIGPETVRRQKFFLIATYFTAAVLTIIYVVKPETYLLPSVPKMYFPNYYVAGSLQWVMRLIFDMVVPLYFLIYLFIYMRKADLVMKNRVKYFLIAICSGYLVGSLAIPLVYDIPVDPLYAAFFVPILAVPMSYAILRYNLMDINLVTKRAIQFSLVIALWSFGIFIVGYANSILRASIPEFPSWLIPLVAGCVATGIGFVVWRKFREADLLKYEFITIVMHKFRTPITWIKWSADSLSPMIPVAGADYLKQINKALSSLMDLTDIVTKVSIQGRPNYVNMRSKFDLAEVCRKAVLNFTDVFAAKKIALDVNGLDTGPFILRGDQAKIQEVVEILLSNCVAYTPENGHVSFFLGKEKMNANIRISDSGIGLSGKDQDKVFFGFYRTEQAKSVNTEGMGVGLFIAKNIIEKNNGRIWAESAGPGTGATFHISLPME